MAEHVLQEKANPFHDKFTVVRKRVRKTPAVCEECGRDMCEINFKAGMLSSPEYEELAPEEQRAVAAALRKHEERYHTQSQGRVVSDEDLTTEFFASRS